MTPARSTMSRSSREVCAASTWSDTARGVILLRSEEHTSELQSQSNLVCRLLLEKQTSGGERLDRDLAGDDLPARGVRGHRDVSPAVAVDVGQDGPAVARPLAGEFDQPASGARS